MRATPGIPQAASIFGGALRAQAVPGPSAPVAAPDPLKDAVDYLLRRLADLPGGIVSRAPAWHEPPMRSTNVCFTAIGNSLAGAGPAQLNSEEWGVQWQAKPESGIAGRHANAFRLVADCAEPEPLMDGYVAVVKARVWCGFIAPTPAAFASLHQARWSLLLNDNPIPGYLRQAPAAFNAYEVADADKPWTASHVEPVFEMGCPIIVRPGQRLTVVFHLDDVGITVQPTFVANVYGYMYPAPGADGSDWAGTEPLF